MASLLERLVGDNSGNIDERSFIVPPVGTAQVSSMPAFFSSTSRSSSLHLPGSLTERSSSGRRPGEQRNFKVPTFPSHSSAPVSARTTGGGHTKKAGDSGNLMSRHSRSRELWSSNVENRLRPTTTGIAAPNVARRGGGFASPSSNSSSNILKELWFPSLNKSASFMGPADGDASVSKEVPTGGQRLLPVKGGPSTSAAGVSAASSNTEGTSSTASSSLFSSESLPPSFSSLTASYSTLSLLTSELLKTRLNASVSETLMSSLASRLSTPGDGGTGVRGSDLVDAGEVSHLPAKLGIKMADLNKLALLEPGALRSKSLKVSGDYRSVIQGVQRMNQTNLSTEPSRIYAENTQLKQALSHMTGLFEFNQELVLELQVLRRNSSTHSDKEFDILHKTNTELVSTHRALLGRISDVERDGVDKQQRLEHMIEALGDLQVKYETALTTVEDKDTTIRALQLDNTALQIAYRKLAEEMQELASNFSKVSHAKLALTEDNAKLRTQVEELTVSLRNMKLAYENARFEYTWMEGEYSRMKRENEDISGLFSSLKTASAAAEKEMSALKKLEDAYKARLKARDRKLDELLQQQKDIEFANRALKEEMVYKERKWAEEQTALLLRIKDRDATIVELNIALEEKKVRAHQLKKELSDQADLMKQMDHKITTCVAEIGGLKKQKNHLEGEKRQLSSALTTASGRLMQMDQQLEEATESYEGALKAQRILEEEKRNLESELQQSKNRIRELKFKEDQLMTSIETAQKRLEQAQEQSANLERSLQNTLAACKDLEKENEMLDARCKQIPVLQNRLETLQIKLTVSTEEVTIITTDRDRVAGELNAALLDGESKARSAYMEVQAAIEARDQALFDLTMKDQERERAVEHKDQLEKQVDALQHMLDTVREEVRERVEREMAERIDGLHERFETERNAWTLSHTSVGGDAKEDAKDRRRQERLIRQRKIEEEVQMQLHAAVNEHVVAINSIGKTPSEEARASSALPVSEKSMFTAALERKPLEKFERRAPPVGAPVDVLALEDDLMDAEAQIEELDGELNDLISEAARMRAAFQSELRTARDSLKHKYAGKTQATRARLKAKYATKMQLLQAEVLSGSKGVEFFLADSLKALTKAEKQYTSPEGSTNGVKNATVDFVSMEDDAEDEVQEASKESDEENDEVEETLFGNKDMGNQCFPLAERVSKLALDVVRASPLDAAVTLTIERGWGRVHGKGLKPASHDDDDDAGGGGGEASGGSASEEFAPPVVTVSALTHLVDNPGLYKHCPRLKVGVLVTHINSVAIADIIQDYNTSFRPSGVDTDIDGGVGQGGPMSNGENGMSFQDVFLFALQRAGVVAGDAIALSFLETTSSLSSSFPSSADNGTGPSIQEQVLTVGAGFTGEEWRLLQRLAQPVLMSDVLAVCARLEGRITEQHQDVLDKGAK